MTRANTLLGVHIDNLRSKESKGDAQSAELEG
jgi:hypothetical protein